MGFPFHLYTVYVVWNALSITENIDALPLQQLHFSTNGDAYLWVKQFYPLRKEVLSLLERKNIRRCNLDFLTLLKPNPMIHFSGTQVNVACSQRSSVPTVNHIWHVEKSATVLVLKLPLKSLFMWFSKLKLAKPWRSCKTRDVWSGKPKTACNVLDSVQKLPLYLACVSIIY